MHRKRARAQASLKTARSPATEATDDAWRQLLERYFRASSEQAETTSNDCSLGPVSSRQSKQDLLAPHRMNPTIAGLSRMKFRL